MKRVLTGQEEIFGPWMMKILGSEWIPGKGSIIGLWEDGTGPIAGCLFESSNGASIMLHIAADSSKRWMNREYLWYVFHYPFMDLGVNKILSPVEASNETCCRFVEHIGFIPEATLKDAAPKGDLIIYTMTGKQCRWLNLRDKYRGEAQSTKTT